MKDKFIMAVGLGVLLLGSDYISQSFRKELKRIGRLKLRSVTKE